MPSAHWVNNTDDLYDFLAQVIVCAPDKFIEADFLPPDEQLNLDRAYEELQRGLGFLKADGVETERLESLQLLLDDSHAAFRTGEAVKAAHMLQDFERLAFKFER